MPTFQEEIWIEKEDDEEGDDEIGFQFEGEFHVGDSGIGGYEYWGCKGNDVQIGVDEVIPSSGKIDRGSGWRDMTPEEFSKYSSRDDVLEMLMEKVGKYDLSDL